MERARITLLREELLAIRVGRRGVVRSRSQQTHGTLAGAKGLARCAETRKEEAEVAASAAGWLSIGSAVLYSYGLSGLKDSTKPQPNHSSLSSNSTFFFRCPILIN